MMRVGFLMLLGLLLSGCMSEKERMLKEGYPAEYATGYEDGCATGRGRATGYGSIQKKIRLYQSSKDYSSGWNDGQIMCFSKEKAIQDASLRYALERKLNEKK